MHRTSQVFLGTLAVLAMLAAAALGAWDAEFARQGTVADGVVVSAPDPYHTDVRFAGPAGRDVVYRETHDTAPRSLGQRVRVRYRPEDPAGTARIDSVSGLYGAAISMGVAGLLGLVAVLLSPALVRRFPRLLAARDGWVPPPQRRDPDQTSRT